MPHPLDPFDFDGEDDEDAATVLMSGHQRHLLREALRTPAPLDALVLEQKEESEASAAAIQAPAAEVEPADSRWVTAICAVVLAVAVAMSAYAILVARP